MVYRAGFQLINGPSNYAFAYLPGNISWKYSMDNIPVLAPSHELQQFNISNILIFINITVIQFIVIVGLFFA